MSDKLFDIARLRKNWLLSAEETAPAREEEECAPPEPLEQAREALAQLKQLAAQRFPTQRGTLDAFFREVDAHLEPPQPGPEALLAAQATLEKLEELLEVFALGLAR
jgi:hypothetical protein